MVQFAAKLTALEIKGLTDAILSGRVTVERVTVEFERAYSDLAHDRLSAPSYAQSLNEGRLAALEQAGKSLEPRVELWQDGRLRLILEPDNPALAKARSEWKERGYTVVDLASQVPGWTRIDVTRV